MIDDARLDELLQELPRHDASGDVVAHVLEAIVADGVAPAARRRSPPPWLFAVAAVLVAGLAWQLRPAPVPTPGPTASGMVAKGDGAISAHVELGLSLMRDGLPVAMPPGARVRPDDTLLFRYTVDRDGFVYLMRFDGKTTEVFSGVAATAGTHHFEVRGEVQGYSVKGLTGKQDFAAAWSAGPWPAGATGPTPPADLWSDGSAVVLDRRTVTVESRP